MTDVSVDQVVQAALGIFNTVERDDEVEQIST
jgi:hypothetical protein